jgi:oxygen-independent coproporphyrinogen-3 oxidase
MPSFRTIQWDRDLIDRYNVSGPRYTSYPTALQFNASVDVDYYQKALASISEDAPLSLYIHIPFCWHVCYYCACNKVVTRDYTRVNPYLEALEKEMALVAQYLKGQPVKQMHWGGGTPTFLNPDDRKRLVDRLHHYFNLVNDAELESSIEVDPRTVSPEAIAELRQLGFNRLSLGIQDFNPKVQQAVNREQSYDDTLALVNAARQHGFRSLSFDLIYGLPHQSVDTFNQTLEQVIGLRPDRLSVFNYAHLPHRFKPQRRINAEDLPSGEEKLAILQLTIEKMQQAGYVYIGMDHFALPDDELAQAQNRGELHRNFQGYTTHKECDLIGLGVSSIGSIGGNYIQNQRELTDYYAALEQGELPVWRGAQVTRDDEIRKAVIFQIICNFELSIPVIESQFGIKFWDYFANTRTRLEQMQADGLIELTDQRLTVTDRGRLFVRNVCMVFDGYLFGQEALIAYSKAI